MKVHGAAPNIYRYSSTPTGFPPSGSTAYYSANASKEDAALVQTFLDAQGISGYNTRLFKSVDDGSFLVRQAAAEEGEGTEGTLGGGGDVSVKVQPGDYAPLMARVVVELEQAKQHAANEHQKVKPFSSLASLNVQPLIVSTHPPIP